MQRHRKKGLVDMKSTSSVDRSTRQFNVVLVIIGSAEALPILCVRYIR